MLESTYLPAWKAAVQQANAKGVMCSYNSLNGVPTCADPKLKKLLRETWNFTGYITSDTDAVSDMFKEHHYSKSAPEACCQAMRDGGCDMDSGGTYWNNLLDGVSSGLCNMSTVDVALANTMRLRFELGLFDPIDKQPYWDTTKYGLASVNTPL